MEEEKTLLIVGGKKLTLKKTSYEKFRRRNLTHSNRYLIYYDGKEFWEILKEVGLPAVKEQIEKFLKEERSVKEDHFETGLGIIPIYFYNSLLEFKEIPAKIKIWFKTLKAFLEEGKVIELPSYDLKHRYILRGSQKIAILKGEGLSLLYDWLYRVYLGKIRIKICEADCNRIFIISRKDQRFCCEKHRAKTLHLKSKEK